jgi:hypothetical protein
MRWARYKKDAEPSEYDGGLVLVGSGELIMQQNYFAKGRCKGKTQRRDALKARTAAENEMQRTAKPVYFQHQDKRRITKLENKVIPNKGRHTK